MTQVRRREWQNQRPRTEPNRGLNITLCVGKKGRELEDGSRAAEGRDRESEEEVCDFGVGAGA